MAQILPFLFCGIYSLLIFALGFGIGRNGLPKITWTKQNKLEEQDL